MHVAACNGQLEVVKFLLAQGASVNPKDRYNSTPLEDAIRENQNEVASYFRDWIGHDSSIER